jgi:tape measure domain-containing protein
MSLVVTANAAPLQQGLAGAGGSVSSFASKVNGAGGSLGGFSSVLSGVGIAAGAMAAAGVVALGSALVGAVGSGIKMAASMEQVAISLKTMLGSADKAKALLSEIKEFAASTPFEFPELADSAKKLLAFGSGADIVVAELGMIGDIASGAGIPIGELSELYGKARVQGTLFAEDINQLTGRGIPIIQEFAKQMGVTEAQVKKLASEGKIGFAQLQKAFIDLTSEGGKFEGMTQAQSQSIAGLWSTLQDAIGEQLTKIGASIIENFDLADTIQTAIKWIGVFGEKLVWLVDKIGAVAKPLMNAFNAVFGEDPSAAAAAAAAKKAENQKKLLEDNAKNVAKQKADQLTAGIDSTTKKLQEQIATFGDSSAEVQIWKLQQQGATEAQLESVRALNRQLESLDANKKAMEEQKRVLADMANQAAKYIEAIKTPYEKLEETLSEIGKLQEQNLLTAEQAEKARSKAADDILKSREKQKKDLPEGRNFFGEKLAAVERRFTAGFTAQQVPLQQKLFEESKKQTKLGERTARATERIAKETEADEVVSI